MSDACTYEVYSDKGAAIESHQCGKPVVITFKKDGRAFPRCKRHSSDSTKLWAENHGYEIHDET